MITKLHLDMAFADYRRLEGVNASAIMAGQTSMLHMRAEMTRADDEPTDAMKWGSVVHAAMLEQDRFDAQKTVWTGGRKAGGAWEACKAEAQDKRLIVKPDELDKLQAMRARLYANNHATQIIAECDREVSAQWDSGRYGPGKARIDLLSGNCIADYKTTRSIKPDAFWRAAYNLGYHIRMGWYVHGIEAITGKRLPAFLVVQESASPYDCWTCHIPAPIIEIGEAAAVETALKYHIAETIGRYDGAVDGMLEYELPAWAGGAEWTVSEGGES